jgi:hypothetical protein
MNAGDHNYSIGEFFNLNDGIVKPPESFVKLMSNYSMPKCCLEEPYINKYNKHFQEASQEHKIVRSTRIRRAETHNLQGDDKILTDIKNAFSSVTDKKDGTVLPAAQINQMIIPESKLSEISQLFYDTIIQSPNMSYQYIKLLFTLKRLDNKEDKIRFEFCKLVKQYFNNPPILPDTVIMDSATRTQQHREASCIIYATLFGYHYDSMDLKGPKKIYDNSEKLESQLITPIINSVNNHDLTRDERTNHLKCLVEVLSIIKKSGKFTQLMASLETEIKKIYQDKTIRLGKRLLLKDFIND